MKILFVPVFVLFLVPAGEGFRAPLSAQAPATTPGSTHTPVFVTLPDWFPDVDAHALLVREPGRDVVVLHPEAPTVENLAVALMVLRRVRSRTPRPEGGQLIPITGFLLEKPLAETWATHLAGTLTRLLDRPNTRVGNLGEGRWVRYRARGGR